LVKRIALMALMLASLASGQWLGEKLSLLDPFGIPDGQQSLAYNSRNHTVYVSGDLSDSILVIDADRCKSIARVGVGRPVGAMCYNPAENKLYCAYAYADTVAVLDGTSHQMLAKVGVGATARTFCYDSIDNKLYVASKRSATVTVLDCGDDREVATIGGVYRDTTWLASRMCFAPAHKTVYITSPLDSSVVAIDCSGDTVLARIPAVRYPYAVCYNPTNDRVYCACRGDTILGIDVATNQVVSVVPRSGAALACDPARNILLAPHDYSLAVIDCSADTVLAEVELPDDAVDEVGYDPAGDKIYVVHQESG
jgi:YVTN family beta-propeller protein